MCVQRKNLSWLASDEFSTNKIKAAIPTDRGPFCFQQASNLIQLGSSAAR
jgi:hypothetical protein